HARENEPDRSVPDRFGGALEENVDRRSVQEVGGPAVDANDQLVGCTRKGDLHPARRDENSTRTNLVAVRRFLYSQWETLIQTFREGAGESCRHMLRHHDADRKVRGEAA